MYECNPLAFIAEQAGALASTGKRPILDILPQELHQRTPLIIGSRDMVSMFEQYVIDQRDAGGSLGAHPLERISCST